MRILAVILFLISTSVLATDTTWPNLADIGHVKGRAATEDDVRQGKAAFVIKVAGIPAGTPLNIQIPQYAVHVEEGTAKETPVVVIQAEENQGVQAVGYVVVGEGAIGASLLRELRLLGTEPPR